MPDMKWSIKALTLQVRPGETLRLLGQLLQVNVFCKRLVPQKDLEYLCKERGG